MVPIEKLEAAVRQLYESHNPDREDWADWLGEHHVFKVADTAADLARRFGAREELARAAAVLHDIADTKMSRFAENHEQESLEMARQLLQAAGYKQDEIEIIVEDAIKYHGCRNGATPSTIEGKVLATADAVVHLTSDFYVHAVWAKGKSFTLEEAKQWVVKKAARDFNDKIRFEEVKEECRQNYERALAVFGM